MSEQFFAMQLEDHSLPEMLYFPKTYYGTLNQIGEFIAHLAADPDTAVKYATTIRAYEDYRNGNLGAVHMIHGQPLRLLTPVNLVFETVILEQDVEWDFDNGVHQFRVRADFVDLHQVLLQDGELYIRAVRPCYEGIQFENPIDGWTTMPACHYGFPHIYAVAPSWHYSRLYTTEQLEMSAQPCLARMQDFCYVTHHEACNDLFGGARGTKQE